MDQTVCSKPLPTDGTVNVRDDGFGIFERWVLRLGCFTARLDERDEFRGSALVFLHPDLPVSQRFVDRVAEYVDRGGKVLVVEAPNAEKRPGEEDELRGRSATAQLARQQLAAGDHRQGRPAGQGAPRERFRLGDRLRLKAQRFAGRPQGLASGAGDRRLRRRRRKTLRLDRRHARRHDALLGRPRRLGHRDRLRLPLQGRPDGRDRLHRSRQAQDQEEAQRIKDVFQWHFRLFPAILNGGPWDK